MQPTYNMVCYNVIFTYNVTMASAPYRSDCELAQDTANLTLMGSKLWISFIRYWNSRKIVLQRS